MGGAGVGGFVTGGSGELVTARLRLRRWAPGDREPFAAICADPEVMRHIGDGRPLTREGAARSLERFEAHWGEQGFGLWAAELRATGALAGFVGLSVPGFLPEVLPAVEIGWRLGRAHWGAGLATEGGRAALDHGFAAVGLDRVVGICAPANVASRRVMARLGLRHERDTTHPALGVPLEVHAVDRTGWERGRPGAQQ